MATNVTAVVRGLKDALKDARQSLESARYELANSKEKAGKEVGKCITECQWGLDGCWTETEGIALALSLLALLVTYYSVLIWRLKQFIAAKALWPEVRPQACQFHYSQNIHKRAKRLGKRREQSRMLSKTALV